VNQGHYTKIQRRKNKMGIFDRFFSGNSKSFEEAYKGVLDEQEIEKARKKREKEESERREREEKERREREERKRREDEYDQAIRLANSHKNKSSDSGGGWFGGGSDNSGGGGGWF
jgi:hypothetical protein